MLIDSRTLLVCRGRRMNPAVPVLDKQKERESA